MNAEEIAYALREAAGETLENLAFTELSPAPDTGLPASGIACARIGLGPDGTLDVVLTENLLGEIASILFNLAPEDLDANVLSDTLLEIANIIAGRFLEKLHGGSDFTMGLPAARADAADWEAIPMRMAMGSGPDGLLALGLARA